MEHSKWKISYFREADATEYKRLADQQEKMGSGDKGKDRKTKNETDR